MIAISASMQEELAIVQKLEFIRTEHRACFEFNLYSYKKHTIVTGVCGTGKVAAAAMAQCLVDTYHPSLIVNIGTAGSISPDVKRKDVVIATETVQHDFSAEPFGYKPGQLIELDRIELDCDKAFLEAAKRVTSDGNIRVHFGRIVTGDIVVVDDEVKERIIERFGGLAADMESAAFGQVAVMNQIPYASLRGISDDESQDRYSEFVANIGSVSENNAEVLLKILDELSEDA